MKFGKNFESSSRKVLFISILLFLVLIFSGLVCLTIGAVNISFKEIFAAIFGYSNSDSAHFKIIVDVRFPRILLAMLVGSGLSLSGAVFQALLKNPLAEPYILGISSGGAFGAILSLILGIGFVGTQGFAFLGALITFILVFIFGRKFGEIDSNTILLSGVMVGAFFSALILLMLSFIDQSFRSALYWLIGNLSLANFQMIYTITPVLILSCIVLISFAQSFNLLSISEENAKQFGINTKLVKNFSYTLTSLLIGVIVSFVGIIGFVGLLIPHLCRLLFGYDNKIVIPSSIFVGAIFLLWADLISRTLIAPSEIPIGAITSLIGAPIFILILKRKKHGFTSS